MPRSSLLLRTTLVVTLLFAAMCTPATASVTRTYHGTDPNNKVEVEANFNDPPSSSTTAQCEAGPPKVCEDRTIMDRLLQMIDDAPSGSHIYAGIHSINSGRVYNALKQAITEGVNVHVMHNGNDYLDEEGLSNDGNPDTHHYPRELAAIPGIKHMWCNHGSQSLYGGGCLSNDQSGIMHAKYMLFSTTLNRDGQPKNFVTWMGSSNLTTNTSTRFNNSITVYNDQKLYSDTYWSVYAQMSRQAVWPSNDFYDPATANRGNYTTSIANPSPTKPFTLTGYVSPEQDTDLIVDRLDSLKADSTCQVYVMQAILTGSRPPRPGDASSEDGLVEKLDDLARGGCKVQINLGWKDTSGLEPDAACARRKLLSNPNVQMRETKYIHDKAIFVYGTYNGVAQRYALMTGSHNLSYSALRLNDELLIRVLDDFSLWMGYYWHFRAAWDLKDSDPSRARAIPLPSCSR